MPSEPLREAAQELADREPIVTDGETGDEWCLYCDASYPKPKHQTWCSWVLLRAALAAAPREASEPLTREGALKWLGIASDTIDRQGMELDSFRERAAAVRAMPSLVAYEALVDDLLAPREASEPE